MKPAYEKQYTNVIYAFLYVINYSILLFNIKYNLIEAFGVFSI